MAAVVQKTYTPSTGCVILAGDTLLHEAAAATPIMEESYISRVLVLVISACRGQTLRQALLRVEQTTDENRQKKRVATVVP